VCLWHYSSCRASHRQGSAYGVLYFELLDGIRGPIKSSSSSSSSSSLVAVALQQRGRAIHIVCLTLTSGWQYDPYQNYQQQQQQRGPAAFSSSSDTLQSLSTHSPSPPLYLRTQ
jgi:hypothetical protein